MSASAIATPTTIRLKYRKVAPAIWNDNKFRSLDDAGKLVFFLLLTHPSMTALGAMRMTPHGLATELGWPPFKLKKAFGPIKNHGMARYDDAAGVVWLPNFLRYNGPESPNVVKAWRAGLESLPEGKLRDQIVDSARAFVETLPQAFGKAFGEAFAKAMPYPEQEPEQEQEQEHERAEALRGTRLPPDWTLPNNWAEEAISIKPNWTIADCRRVAEIFRDYWIAQPSQKGVKSDWQATWRNWVRKEHPAGQAPEGRGGNGAGAPPEKCARCGGSLAAGWTKRREGPTCNSCESVGR